MTVEETISSQLNTRCPYLGLKEDADTALGFPSMWNFCHNAKPIATPHQEHQQEVCLTETHKVCLVFLVEEKNALPADLLMAKHRTLFRVSPSWVIALLLLLILVLVGLILSGYWEPAWLGNLPIP